ncbi:MAG: EAL domain-containing protein [Enterobacterales bacterium]|nr:EAL domain-containing protein [Enterobacterales bacterium]
MKEFTYFVIDKVLETLKCNPNFPHVSINLSIKQFYSDDFIQHLDNIFRGFEELQPHISFEITESLFHEDPKVLLKGIKQLRARGFRISIDDFGTGYSSFSYIRNFTADIIKIDRAFVIDIESNEKNYDLLKGMVALLQSMNADVVIEGVENQQQMDKIRKFSHSVKIQGNYFHYPMPLINLLVAVDRQDKVAEWDINSHNNNQLVNHFLEIKKHQPQSNEGFAG